MRITAGSPTRLGAWAEADGVNFALFSANAEAVELCLFTADGERETARLILPECSGGIWHGHVAGLGAGAVYGYRVHGKYAPAGGHRFNPNKLLLDPYARAFKGAFRWGPEVHGYVYESGDTSSFDSRNSAGHVPKCVVVAEDAPLEGARPRVRWPETVAYEAHVRGLTMQHAEVPEALRGRFGGVVKPAVIEHMRALGVTSVELLPVQHFIDDLFLIERGLSNYWGYNTIGFFAPHPRYAGEDAIGEFRAMARALHAAGIELILDVVYNHTAEGDERGPTLCFRGIDNASYYRLEADPSRYVNYAGTGNMLNASHAFVIRLIMDSLRYWAATMGADGFRFDLAPVLAREDAGFDSGAGFLDCCAQDPVLARCKLIAEPWDIGPGGYQLGGFPPGWAEWNDRFRDTVRRFWRGDAGMVAEMATRLAGSSDRFGAKGRSPWASVNFITAHDGMTLADLVSYSAKHNLANREDNRDGNGDDCSFNYGHEGGTGDAVVNALRLRQMRNFLATLFLAQGTPMLLAGDEFGRTQLGNNNAYCQDNTLSWVDWGLAGTNADLMAFAARVAGLRRRYAVLRQTQFLTGADAVWLHYAGREMSGADWQDGELRCLGMLLSGEAERVMLVLNAGSDEVRFALPAGQAWRAVLDTTHETGEADYAVEGAVVLGARTAMLLVAVQ